MKIVCLDVGEKRIGMATADTSVRIAVPHSTVLVDGSELKQITRAYLLEKASLLVVGLPRNSQGEETAQSKTVRAFIISLEDFFVKHKLQKPRICFQDESLTSVIAEQNLTRRHRQIKQKGDIDREAATLILQDFIESHHPEMIQNMARPISSAADVNTASPCQSSPATAPESPQAQAKPKKKSKMANKLAKTGIFLLAFSMVAVVGLIAAYSYFTSPMLNAEACEQNSTATCNLNEFEIQDGESTDNIASRLENDGYIRSSLVFKIYLKIENRGSKLKAGMHKVSATMSTAELVRTLESDPAAETMSLTILPGETLRSIRPKFVRMGFSDAEIDSALAADYDHPLLKSKPAGLSLEGYLYGETYEFYANASLQDILAKIFDEFYALIQANELETKFEARGLSLHEAITLASVIQREAYATDQPQVAQVFLLRLQQGIVLGSDAIIGYAADQINPDRDKTDMSYLETIECPWNSRRCQGLPPTPIAGPSKSALLAVANPAEGDYLYFLTGDDGKMYYARTEAEHNQNIQNHCQKMCQIL